VLLALRQHLLLLEPLAPHRHRRLLQRHPVLLVLLRPLLPRLLALQQPLRHRVPLVRLAHLPALRVPLALLRQRRWKRVRRRYLSPRFLLLRSLRARAVRAPLR